MNGKHTLLFNPVLAPSPRARSHKVWMVSPTHSNQSQQQIGWCPHWRALWAFCWRLSIMLVFCVGALFCFLLDHLWGALACVFGFFIAAFLIRRVSTVERDTSSEDSIIFL